MRNDPLRVLATTRAILDGAQHVALNKKALPQLAEQVRQRIAAGLGTVEEVYGSGGSLEKDVQLIFIEDALNFCFWEDAGKEKWSVEYPQGKVISGGWYALKAALERALAEGIPLLEAPFLATLSLEQAQYIFRSASRAEIPLLQERVDNLREIGEVLLKKYHGQFLQVIIQSGCITQKLVERVCADFPSFRDISHLDGKEVFILKRPQILVHDLSCLTSKFPEFKIEGVEQLTAMADYRLPQVLRHFGVLEYNKELATKLANLELLQHDSREEIEIRAATVWGIELLAELLPEHTSAELDMAVWMISQDLKKEMQPYHRCRTIYY